MILKECGWETPFLPYDQVISYCIPRESSRFLKVLFLFKIVCDNIKIIEMILTF